MHMRFFCVGVAVLLALTGPTRAESLKIKGSNTFGESLGPRLIEAFRIKYPEILVDLESRNSGYGILTLLDGACDIAAASRALNEDEMRIARSRRLNLLSHTIGFYGISVVVHPANPLANLSDRQVRDIFTGAITNWSELGGAPVPIAVHISSPEAGTYLGFQELALDRKPYRQDAIPHPTYAEIAQAVAADPNAIGYISMSLAERMPVRPVSINGVPPTQIAVADDLYPYARMLRFFTVRGRESKAALSFIRFVRSNEGQNVLEQAGFVRRFRGRYSFGHEVP